MCGQMDESWAVNCVYVFLHQGGCDFVSVCVYLLVSRIAQKVLNRFSRLAHLSWKKSLDFDGIVIIIVQKRAPKRSCYIRVRFRCERNHTPATVAINMWDYGYTDTSLILWTGVDWIKGVCWTVKEVCSLLSLCLLYVWNVCVLCHKKWVQASQQKLHWRTSVSQSANGEEYKLLPEVQRYL